MSWLICGTVPDPGLELLYGQAAVQLQAGSALRPDAQALAKDAQQNDRRVPGGEGALSGIQAEISQQNGKNDKQDILLLRQADAQEIALPINRGTAALAAAATLVCAELGVEAPYLLLAGDRGTGKGSRLVYDYLLRHAAQYAGWGLTFHYLLPDVEWHNKLLHAFETLEPRPMLCADAGFMYVAKMSGQAAKYDLFTPDAGELAFLADEKAPHPFYTRGFLLAEEEKAPELAARAESHGNAARTMLIKGRTDYIVQAGQVLESIDYPLVPNLEPIGGTGDTVAGTVSALLSAGYPIRRACRLAALTNRFMGQLAQPSPATQIAELLAQLPGALQLALQEL